MRVRLVCASAWYANGRELDPHIRLHSFMKFGQEIISMAILSLPLFQEEQLSVTGKRLCTKYSVLLNCLGVLPRSIVDLQKC